MDPDSGVTDHVTTFPHLFSLCKKINHVIVRLLNGHTVTTTHASRVQFSQFLYLEDVLYIPSFQFDLISVSKLVSSLYCILTFMNDKCFIQDLQNLQRIGIVDMVEGLYRLNMVPLKPHREYSSNSITVHVYSNVSSILAFSCNKKTYRFVAFYTWSSIL